MPGTHQGRSPKGRYQNGSGTKGVNTAVIQHFTRASCQLSCEACSVGVSCAVTGCSFAKVFK